MQKSASSIRAYIGVCVAGLLISPMIARAQVLTGLPEYSLTLTGDPGRPLLSNHSGRRVVVYTVSFGVVRGGSPYTISQSESALLNIRNRLEDVRSVSPGGQRVIPMNGLPGDKIQSVSLDAVIFEDGEVAGTDASHTADRIAALIDAERDLAEAVLSGTGASQDRPAIWDTVKEAARRGGFGTVVTPRRHDRTTVPGRVRYYPLDMGVYSRIYGDQQKRFAEELLRVQQKAGDTVALDFAGRSSVYPGLWRRK